MKKNLFHAQCINLISFTLALIVENDYKCAVKLVDNKEMTNLLVILMQITEEKDRDRNYKKRIVKGASLLVASMTSVRESDDPEKL